MVGDDPASQVYVGNKERSAHKIGMNSVTYKLSADISEEDLISKINELNKNNKIHGILVQLPLPKHIDTNKIIHCIDPKKMWMAFTW